MLRHPRSTTLDSVTKREKGLAYVKFAQSSSAIAAYEALDRKVVEFDKPDEVAKAFRAVAYRRLGNLVVYLEKDPLGMFVEGTDPGSSSPASTPASSSTPRPVIVASQGLDDAGELGEEQSIFGGSTLYVKHLSLSTTQERLTQMFRHLPSFSLSHI